MTNEELVQKGIITADNLAAQGKLNPQQADKFLDYVIDETKLKNAARMVKFKPESLEIDKIGVGRRAAVPKSEATDPGVRRGITTSKVTLTPKEVMVPVEIGDTFKDINIEGEDIETHIIKMFATQLANDLEELYVLADILGPAVLQGDIVDGGSTTQYIKDNYLALMNGWLRLADSGNVVDALGGNIESKIFSLAIKAMPSKFKRNREQLRFLIASDLEQNYREKISTRATGAGDVALSTTKNLTPFGIEAVQVPLLPLQPTVVEHVVVNTDGTTATALRYKPVTAIVVTPTTITGDTPITPYILDTDYSQDLTNGTITRLTGGAIGSGATVKVTYSPYSQMLLTHFRNLVLGIGRDVRIEKDRDIFKGVNQYAITVKAAVEIENIEAVVKVVNIGLS